MGLLVIWIFFILLEPPYDTTEINKGTLESKLVSGLYFAGEVMDVDGDCGGYNLQWAWSSGYAAAKGLTDHIAR